MPFSPDAKLQRLVTLTRQGQLAQAQLELHAWTRQADCPPEARIMLAAMLAQQQDYDAARAVLAHASTPEEAKMLIAVLISAGLNDAARRTAQALHQREGHDPAIADWLKAMNVPGCRELPTVTQGQVDQLVSELMDRPGLIVSLVAAQQHEPDPESIALLRQAAIALAKAYEGDEVFVALCQALADLAVLAGDVDDARRWAHRGLKIDPYCASLALVLGELSDEPGVGPAARQVLARVARKYPHYPDVRASMIRRAAADGRSGVAKRRLSAWLRRDPHSPTALRLKQELAA